MNDLKQYLVVMLNGEKYAFNIQSVYQIVRNLEITKLSKVPGYVKGLIHVFNRTLPLLSLRVILDDPEPFGAEFVTIIFHDELQQSMFGLMVDDVVEVVTIPEEVIDLPLMVSNTDQQAMIMGVAKLDSGLVVLLNLDKILSDDQKSDLKKIKEPKGKASGKSGRSTTKKRPG